eukprot:gene8834-biopygen19675
MHTCMPTWMIPPKNPPESLRAPVVLVLQKKKPPEPAALWAGGAPTNPKQSGGSAVADELLGFNCTRTEARVGGIARDKVEELLCRCPRVDRGVEERGWGGGRKGCGRQRWTGYWSRFTGPAPTYHPPSTDIPLSFHCHSTVIALLRHCPRTKLPQTCQGHISDTPPTP